MEIKKVLICGLGSLGTVCAATIYNSNFGELKILVDEQRLNKYKNNPTFFNDQKYEFEYITPDETNYKADLIIIGTKQNGLNSAILNIKNFVKEDTIIISLLNGISSEEEIAKIYDKKNIPLCFYIGASCVRNERKISLNGDYSLIIGNNTKTKSDIVQTVSEYFKKTGIKHKISDNIQEEYLKKLMINVGLNQISAVSGYNINEIKKDKNLTDDLKTLMKEVMFIAKAKGIKNYEKMYHEAEHFIFEEMKTSNTSMSQDIKAKRKTEVELFAGTVIKLGKELNIPTPKNEEIYYKITKLEKTYL